MKSRLIFLVLILAVQCKSNLACNLTERVLEETSGLVHRCLNISGTNEWHRDVACWIRWSSRVIQFEVDEKYIQPNGREVAYCRQRRSQTALVYVVCFDGPNATMRKTGNESIIRWPGDVWKGDDGLQYTCTNASLSTSSWYFDQSSRIVLFGCNSTQTGRIVSPEYSQRDPNGLVRKCLFDGRNTRDPRYSMKPVGCWIKNRTTGGYDELDFGNDYYIYINQKREHLASCRKKYSGEALVYQVCRQSDNAEGEIRLAGSVWTDSNGNQRECLPANPSELVSAKVILRACRDNDTILSPGSEMRVEDGSVWRCVFSRYKSEYGWFDAVGCWLKDSHWFRLTNFSSNLHVGSKLCIGDGLCLAKCEKRRYRDEVALVATVCVENVGTGVKFRIPHENWTDDTGVDRMCIPMADQSYKFGVGAETILRGCTSKNGDGIVRPGTLVYSRDFLVYECSYNSYKREYNFEEIAGCWMHDSKGQRIFIASGDAFRLSPNQTVVTCRKKRYSSRVQFTVEVCFNDNQASLLNWNTSRISFPRDVTRNGSNIMECDPAATYSDGINAKWIVRGCPLETGILTPGSRKPSEDGIIWECEHNGREGSLAAYSWIKPVGCWFKDHLNQMISISQFNVPYIHSLLKRPVAICEHRSYSNPSLKMLVCFSPANGHVFREGDEWSDGETGFAKQCVSTSSYSDKSVVEIYAGCWLQAPTEGNSTEVGKTLLSANGTVAHDAKNRVLRCDFNQRSRQYEWRTSVACWYTNDNGTFTVLPIGQEYWSKGMLIYKCLETRNGAVFVHHSCLHNGTWYPAMSVWRDSKYAYKCQPASGDRSAEVQKTHCITDDGTAITETKNINDIQYVCMRICGFLVFMRQPTPDQYRSLFSFINDCHATNMNIIKNIG